MLMLAMLLLVVMALATVVIDLGMVRLTRTQMKNSTSAAALEAFSLANVDPADRSTYVSPNATTDLAMRQAAVDRVSNTFDDDFDPTSDAYQLGVGPSVTYSGGVAVGGTTPNASELLSVGNPPVSKPSLELNLTNNPTGDVVIGNGNVTVQMQRTLDGDNAGVNWNGGPVPVLFGRAVLRTVGLTLSSTASIRPVVVVGVKQAGPTVTAGAITFAIRDTTWNALPQNSASSVSLNPAVAGPTANPATSIGQQVLILTNQPTADSGYVAIVNSSGYVIGFGWADVSPVDATSATVLKHANTTGLGSAAACCIASENATARLSAAWDTLALLDSATRQAIINANRSFSDPLVAGVLED